VKAKLIPETAAHEVPVCNLFVRQFAVFIFYVNTINLVGNVIGRSLESLQQRLTTGCSQNSCMISRFRRDVNENCAVLGYYAASIGNLMFR
jgi:hypothetical protein